MQTEPVSKQIQELQALKAQKRYLSWGTMGILILFVIGCILSLRNAVNALVQEGETRTVFQKRLSESVQKDALPEIQRYGEEAIRGVDYSGAAKKLNARTPEIVKATLDQISMLNDDLTKRGNSVFDKTFAEAVKGQDKKIRALFPDANEEKVNGLIANLTKEAQEQVVDVNATLFGEHKKALDSIVSDLSTIQHSEQADIKGEPASWELALMIFDIARDDLKSLQIADADKKDAGKNAAKPTAGKEKK